MTKKSYDDFADAFYKLKKENGDISYGKISMATGILEATINALANRRRANPPTKETIDKIAKFFHVTPDYFYEWRLKKLLEFMNEKREFVDYCIRQSKKYKKELPEEEVEPELMEKRGTK